MSHGGRHDYLTGPNPTGITVSPNGCQSLQVTWTHRTSTSPLTLNHYRVRYQPQGGSHRLPAPQLRVPIHSLVLLLPQHTQSEWTHKPNLDMGTTAVYPQPQLSFSDACIGSQGDCNTLQLQYRSNFTGIQHAFCTNEQIATQFCINPGIPPSKDHISICSDMLMPWTWSVQLPLLQWVSHWGSHWSGWYCKEQSGSPELLQLTCVDWPTHSTAFSMGGAPLHTPHTPSHLPPHNSLSLAWKWDRSTL